MVKFNPQKLLRAISEPKSRYAGVKGSIVRMRIQNFVTYRDVELHAGPNINLVLGPNGTGKSTVVCAICLGLGGKAKILSRAENVKEYIRHGTKEAKVEIELFNPDGENYIVQRTITEAPGEPHGVRSTWTLQGRPVKEKKVEELMHTLNIQLNNLCQFLPQDRVQDFARMEPVSLLKCTEMAVGSDELSSKHDELVSLNSSIKKLEYSLNNIEVSLQTEQQHNVRLQTEVQTFREREELNAKINELKGKQLWIAYQNALNAFNILKEQENVLKKSKEEEERLIAPLKKAVDRLEASAAKYRDQINKLRNNITSKTGAMSRSYTSAREAADTSCNEIMVAVEADENEERERRGKLRQLQSRIQSSEADLEEAGRDQPVDRDVAKREVDAWLVKKTEVSRQIIETNQLDDQDTSVKNGLQRRIENCKSELTRMGDMRVSRMTFLERFYPDVAKTIRYFEKEENRDKLKGKLWDPPILHVFVDDLKFGSVAEKHIRVSDLTAFYCEHKDDVYTVSDLVYKDSKARVSVIHHVCPPGFKKPRSAFTREFMQKYHFERVLIDLIQAPDYYMSYLVPTFKPEYVPMGGPALDQLMGKIMDETDLKAFYSEEYAYFVRVSSYSRDKFSTCTHLSAPRIFTTKINENEQNAIRESIAASQGEIDRLDAAIQGRSAGLKKLESEKTAIDAKIHEIRARADHYTKLKARLTTMKAQAQELESQKKDLEELRRRANDRCCDRRIRQLENVERGANSLEDIVNEGLNQTIARKQLGLLDKLSVQKANQYDEAKTNLTEILASLRAKSAEVKELADKSANHKKEAMEQSKLNSPPDDVRLGEVNEDSVKRDLSLATVKLDFLPDTNPDVIRRFHERQTKINELEGSKTSRKNDLENLNKKLEETKTQWLGPLTELVDRINKNFANFFASMQCAGQVYLDTGVDANDFSGYGIKIKTKFRAAEQLTDLSGWKQSGGERAITTALYILALQELTTVPFRVIDEINQGMDAKNEARFFNLLCSLAEGENTPQYFLLTPKMLPDVRYPDNVKFHIIFSGPHVRLKNFADSKGIQFSYDEEDPPSDEEEERESSEQESSEQEEDEEEEDPDPEQVDLSD